MGKKSDNKSGPGIVYVLTNDAMPNFIKIGITRKEKAEERADELFNTSVPFRFKVIDAIKVDNPEEVEEAIFLAYIDRRVPKREYLHHVSPNQIMAIFKILPKYNEVNITEEIEKLAEQIESPEEKQGEAEFKRRKNRPVMDFETMGIPIESELIFVKEPERRAIVVSRRKVKFDDQEV